MIGEHKSLPAKPSRRKSSKAGKCGGANGLQRLVDDRSRGENVTGYLTAPEHATELQQSCMQQLQQRGENVTDYSAASSEALTANCFY
jgi:hypothetical protein